MRQFHQCPQQVALHDQPLRHQRSAIRLDIAVDFDQQRARLAGQRTQSLRTDETPGVDQYDMIADAFEFSQQVR